MKIKIFVLIIGFSLMVGCASSKKSVKQGDSGAKNIYDESFDPSTLNDDDIEITGNNSAVEQENLIDKTTEDRSNGAIEELQRNGFRIQISATSSLEKATLVQQEVSARFAEKNLKSYLIFESPLYKVRVGNAIDRDEANTIRDFMLENGYKDSFVVPSKVIISKDSDPFGN
jgi:TolA-binding protein